jgi:hypothetical protein
MGLKFRRGTTAQKSGSLAFGEPYVNTDLNTLQVGGANGDILLAAAGTSSVFVGQSVSASSWVSASSLHVTGNANVGGDLTIGGKIQIGDNSSDTVNVVASLSSSLIPSETNTFDLGSINYYWRDLYISTGSIKMVSNGVVVSTLSNTGNGFLLDQGITARGDSSFGTSSAAVTSVTGSLRVSGSVAVIGELSASTINGIGNVSLYSSSVASRMLQLDADMFNVTASVQAINIWTSSVSTTTSLNNLSASIYQTDATQSNNITATSQSAWGAFQSASAYSASAATVATTNANSAAGAFASASSYSGSFYTTINSVIGTVTTAQNSANGAFASASAYSASAAVVAITNANAAAGAFASASAYSASNATTDNTQTANILTAQNSANGAFASASAYSGSFYTTINTVIGTVTTAQNTGAGAFASASAYSASAVTTYAKLAVANTFTANQIVSGSITATGDVVAYSTSDKRHKNNIVNITDALAKVTKLNGVTWEWNEDVDSATKETPKTGLIAQEVQEVLPEVVKERGDGFLALDYSKMMGLMVEAIKEQQTQIAELKAEIEALKK